MKTIIVKIEGVHEYTLKDLGNKFELYYSGGKQWIYPDSLVMTMTDYGSGMQIKASRNDFKTHLKNDLILEYDMVQELRILLDYVDGLKCAYEFVEL